MREGSVVVAAVLITGVVAYWSTHGGVDNWREAEPREEAPVAAEAVRRAAQPEPAAPVTGSPDIPENLDAAGKAAVCAELLEVIRGADAALRDPRSKAAIEQLTAQRQAHQAKRAGLGC
ncbi:hypothetical protein [Zoogloea sp.]|uniref:hypothetical protein n=1 Tax=Zoogloea sp. TaxID=49181 RepID=UPI0035B02D6D